MSREKMKSLLFAGPPLAMVSVFLIYPAIRTFVLSFYGPDSEKIVGIANYVKIFTDSTYLIIFRNNVLWLFGFTAITVLVGLLMAILLDRVPYESVAKSALFMPMAISMAGASIIWKFVYAYKPPGVPQIGVLNAIMTAFGNNPIAWLSRKPWNNFFLIIVGAWIWTGFCLIVLSAAYKNVSKDLMEAARIDGANEFQVFFHVTLPLMKNTIYMVAITMVVFVLKIFDFVYVMTNGNFNTEVIANRMYKAMFNFSMFGRASALAVILFVLTIPFLILNAVRNK